MRIAIVGATGLVGSALVRAAQAAGHDVSALSKESGVDVLQPEGLADLLGGGGGCRRRDPESVAGRG